MDEAQAHKKNKYFDFLCSYTGGNAIPTKNSQLVAIHEKAEN